jgi:putative membrane protein
MDRRSVLLSIAGVTLSSAAFAQAGASPTASTGSPPLGQAEQQWMQQTMAVGSVAMRTSELAVEKARDEDVKQFAQFEVDEQKGIAEVLRSMMGSAGSAAMPPQADQKHAAVMQKLEQSRGKAFDRAYVQAQVDGHQELLQIQEAFIKSSSNNRETMNVAKLAAGRIREHIAILDDIFD